MKSAEERTLWLADRANYVTASDVAAVMGLNPHKNRNRVFKEKVYGGSVDIDGLPQVMAGKHLEAGILSWHLAHRKFQGFGWDAPDALDEMAWLGNIHNISESGLVVHPTSKVLAATPDAITWVDRTQLWATEIKNVGSGKDKTDWATTWRRGPSTTIPDYAVVHATRWQQIDAATLRAPVYYWVQLQAQMSCLGLDKGRIVVCIGGNARADLDYSLDTTFEHTMLTELDKFWAEVLAARELGL